ncbi:MAG: transcription termination/antitermination factor NusG [Planctomycetes bacterium]|nr:transcription termination/antitermination factor NusG [Planctomycetota bacterium]MCB9890754.1 transcription termination/antitermination factor NusG [Planctomycetota bacterium]MCB9917296.1 transcription termination/antitermination factor NusG [Planctomycetota bacterium]
MTDPSSQSQGLQWYIIRVPVGREERVRQNLLSRVKQAGLEDKVPEVLLPVENVSDIKAGKRRVTKRKLFPGYLLVHMEIDEDVWFVLRETPGYQGFVGGGDQPVPMTEDELQRIRGKMEESKEKPKLSISFKAGDRVKIKQGHFENFDGVIEEVNPEKGVVKVSVTIFGRATQVEVEYWEVEQI